MSIKENIENFVTELLENSEHFLVEVVQKGTERFPKIFIYLDGDNGITINDCASVSRKVNKFIEDEEVITTEYGIDVSSPGLDAPLVKKRQYKANIGRNVKVWLLEGEKKEGKLLTVSDEEIELEIKKNKEVASECIPFAQIDKTKVIVTF